MLLETKTILDTLSPDSCFFSFQNGEKPRCCSCEIWRKKLL